MSTRNSKSTPSVRDTLTTLSNEVCQLRAERHVMRQQIADLEEKLAILEQTTETFCKNVTSKIVKVVETQKELFDLITILMQSITEGEEE